MKKETAMDKITTAMAEYICDQRCRFPLDITDQEELGAICGSCEMGQHMCNILNEYNDQTEELKRAHKNAQKMAGELLREKDKHQWIPVKERLPEESEQVLAAGRFDDIQVAYRDKEGWHLAINRRLYNYGPLAWMPLPEHYQQEQEGS